MNTEFRPMRRFKQELPLDQCKEILRNEVHGTLAMLGDNDYPYAIPLHFTYDEAKNLIYLHSATTGQKIDALKSHDKVCFSIYDDGSNIDDKGRNYYRCLVIFGRIRLVMDEHEKMQTAWDFCAKFETPPEIQKHLDDEADIVQMMVLDIDYISGKKVLAEYEVPLHKQ